MADPAETSLKAAIEGARVPLHQKLRRLLDIDSFIALCKRERAEEDRWKRAVDRGNTTKPAPASLVKIWVAEYRASVHTVGTGPDTEARFNYLACVATLAQVQGELDLRGRAGGTTGRRES